METNNKVSKNRQERIIAFFYVSILFVLITTVSCWVLFYYSEGKDETRKEFVIAKMDRIREFQDTQNKQKVIVDSIYNKIGMFDPGVNASYEENDIKFYLNDLKKLHENHSYDGRYKIFLQTSNFYNMWFADRKELWSKQQNIDYFKKDLEKCQIGLEKKKNELKNSKK